MKKYIVFLLGCMLLTFAGCRNDEPVIDNNNPPEVIIKGLTVTPGTIPTIAAEGTVLELKIKSEFDWTIKIEQAWCKTSVTAGPKGNNTLKLVVDANDTYDERNTLIQVIADTIVKNLTVTQKQLNALLVSSNKVEMSANGGSFDIEVKANVDYKIKIPDDCDWLSVDSESRGLTTKKVTFKVKEHTDLSNRSTSVLFNGNGLTEKVTVYQLGAEPSFVLSCDEYVVPVAGDTIKVELQSNCSYSYRVPDLDWIVEKESRAMSSYTHEFIVRPNNAYGERSATIVFVNNVTEKEFPVTITQVSGAAFVVAKSKYQVTSGYNTLELRFQAAVEYKVSVDVDWITVALSRVLDDKYLKLNITNNPTDASRTAHVTLKGEGNQQQIITITQAGLQSFVRLVVTHNQEVFNLPNWSAGYSTQCWGVVDWGDGTNETWFPYLFYKYPDTKQYSVTMDMYEGKSYSIEKIGSISSIVVYINELGKDSDTEDMNVNNKDWDK